MGACSISSLRTFCICRIHRFATIPANIKKNLITNCIVNRLMSMLFSFQSRNFIKLNKANINSFGAKFKRTLLSAFLFLTNYRLKRSLYVKLKDGMSNTHMGRLIWIYAVCISLLLSPVAVKDHIIVRFYLLQ